MKKGFLRTSTICFVAIISVLLGILISYRYFDLKLASTGSNIQNNQEFISKILKLDEIMRNRFLGVINDTDTIDGMIDGYILSTGDNYADYVRKSDYKAYLKYISEGTVTATGLIAAPNKDGNLAVKTVLSDSPAAKVKLQPGDVITEINGSKVSGMSYFAALGRLIVSKDTTIDIVWTRDNLSYSATLEYKSNFEKKSVDYAIFSSENNYFINSDGSEDVKRIVYISIKYFDSTTPDKLNEILSNETIKGLPIVIDLRNNFGGDIDSLQKCADIFVPAGILFTVNSSLDPADEDSKMHYYSDQSEVTVPISVIVNENTAAEAEVFALIIKEYEKGSIIGTKTAGIAGIISTIDLGDETAICITTRKYSLPKGSIFENEGVTPTFDVSLGTANFEKLSYKDDTQLLAALLNFGLKYEEPADPILPEPPTV